MKRVTVILAACCMPIMTLAAPLVQNKSLQHIDLTIVLNAVQDCQPECVSKQFDDFKNGMEDYFDQHKGCEEKFNVTLKQKKLDLNQWYARECIIQCMNVVSKEFADAEDVKGQIGTGAFAFWASKGAIAAVEKVCDKGG